MVTQEDVTNDIEPIEEPRKSAPSQDTEISSNPSTAVEDDWEQIDSWEELLQVMKHSQKRFRPSQQNTSSR